MLCNLRNRFCSEVRNDVSLNPPKYADRGPGTQIARLFRFQDYRAAERRIYHVRHSGLAPLASALGALKALEDEKGA